MSLRIYSLGFMVIGKIKEHLFGLAQSIHSGRSYCLIPFGTGIN